MGLRPVFAGPLERLPAARGALDDSAKIAKLQRPERIVRMCVRAMDYGAMRQSHCFDNESGKWD
jgi:hypothetical protein